MTALLEKIGAEASHGPAQIREVKLPAHLPAAFANAGGDILHHIIQIHSSVGMGIFMAINGG